MLLLTFHEKCRRYLEAERVFSRIINSNIQKSPKPKKRDELFYDFGSLGETTQTRLQASCIRLESGLNQNCHVSSSAKALIGIALIGTIGSNFLMSGITLIVPIKRLMTLDNSLRSQLGLLQLICETTENL